MLIGIESLLLLSKIRKFSNNEFRAEISLIVCHKMHSCE